MLASLRSDVEEFARLAIVSELLKQTGERYREKHQGPVLGRASELFRELTCGAFSGIQTDYDDKGTPIIVGVRVGNSDSDSSAAATASTPWMERRPATSFTWHCGSRVSTSTCFSTKPSRC